jgi:hypothetical protein
VTQFKITTPHTPGLDFHQWYFPNGWLGIDPTERRDKGGKLPGKRDGYFPEWFVLGCNNTPCEGRAVVPVELILTHADASDPEVTQ